MKYAVASPICGLVLVFYSLNNLIFKSAQGSADVYLIQSI